MPVGRVNRKGSWRILERGINGKPFLWKKIAKPEYVMIDVFDARGRRCYPVVALKSNPFSSENARRRLIGEGCGAAPSDWVGAYKQARRIADNYMNTR